MQPGQQPAITVQLGLLAGLLEQLVQLALLEQPVGWQQCCLPNYLQDWKPNY